MNVDERRKDPRRTRSSRRKAIFNEIARRIVARDRAARRYGWSQNTIGEIARNLEWAFTQGVEGETFERPSRLDEEESDAAVDWIDIPPRPREAFHDLFWMRHETAQDSGLDVQLFARRYKDGNLRWSSDPRDQSKYDFGWSASTITPLVKLGLLEPVENAPGVLRITKKGLNTWAAYKRRETAKDPTLPILNARG